MPLYEYRCATCLDEFEALTRDSRGEDVTCPQCGGRSLSRLISRFAVSRQLAPCGTPAAQAAQACGFNAGLGGCGRCQAG